MHIFPRVTAQDLRLVVLHDNQVPNAAVGIDDRLTVTVFNEMQSTHTTDATDQSTAISVLGITDICFGFGGFSFSATTPAIALPYATQTLL